MKTGMRPKRQLLYLGLVVLVAFSGLCTIFVSVTTATQAWQEHAEARWPQVTARVDQCLLQRTSTRGRKRLYVNCDLSYAVGAEQYAAKIFSRQFPAPEVWQDPPDQAAPFAEWVDGHPPGTPILVRYDPVGHNKVVLVAADAPFGGPHTPNNVKLLEVCAVSFLVLLTIARITRPRSPWKIRYSSMPLSS
jgi:hypothetical protein